jgi:deoxyribose-phosphate aldolase
MPLTRAEVAALIDHTLLKPEATVADVDALCAEAVDLGVLAVCVSPSLVPAARRALDGTRVRLAAVTGFPSGAHQPVVKELEAGMAYEQGAHEVDMVIDTGLAKVGAWSSIEHEVTLVRSAVPSPALVKVILETAALEPAQIADACRAAVRGGADFVKTSTGFHPAGGATVEAVRLLRETVGPGVGVKASGGIRTAEQALAMIEAGASRLGCSASRAILEVIPA